MVDTPAPVTANAQRQLARLLQDASAKTRSRNIAEALSARFAMRSSILVLDVSGDTGANLRATAPLLPQRQNWTLIMPGPAAAETARAALRTWADHTETDGDGLVLRREGKMIGADIRIMDLAEGLDAAFAAPPQLVTVAQDSTRYSLAFMRTLAQRCETERAVVHAASIYAGCLSWTPHHATDSAVTAAYHRYLTDDLGFGPAAGAIAASEFEDQLRLAGFSVISDDATVHLNADDAAVIASTTAQLAELARSNPVVDDARLDAWAKRVRSSLRISLTDLLATPQTN